jgi:hypothetical protein
MQKALNDLSLLRGIVEKHVLNWFNRGENETYNGSTKLTLPSDLGVKVHANLFFFRAAISPSILRFVERLLLRGALNEAAKPEGISCPISQLSGQCSRFGRRSNE